MFRGGWTIASIQGVPIRVHVSLLFIIPLLALGLMDTSFTDRFAAFGVNTAALTLGPVAHGVGIAIGVFLAVLLHELGHALVALRCGMAVRGITLMILGGLTEIDQDDASPRDVLSVAAAGPIVNIALGLAALVIAKLVPSSWADASLFLLIFGGLNLFLAAFNLIPALPLDGGRILKAILELSMSKPAASNIATTIGRFVAVVAGLFGLMHGDIVLILIAVFIYFGAGADRMHQSISTALDGLTVDQAMTTRVASLRPGIPVSVAARHLLLQGARAALLRDASGTYGVVTADDLHRTLAESVADLVDGEPLWTDTKAPLREVARLVKWHQKPVIVRDSYNAIVGVVTDQDIIRAARLRMTADRAGSTMEQAQSSQENEI